MVTGESILNELLVDIPITDLFDAERPDVMNGGSMWAGTTFFFSGKNNRHLVPSNFRSVLHGGCNGKKQVWSDDHISIMCKKYTFKGTSA